MKTEAPRRRLFRSSLLATAATGLALVGSGLHGVAGLDGSLERAAAQRDAREAQQLWQQHRDAELGPPPPERGLRYRDVRDRRRGDCPWAPKRREL